MSSKLGLTEQELNEWDEFLKRYIDEVTQDDWRRFHELNDKYLSALIVECWKFEETI